MKPTSWNDFRVQAGRHTSRIVLADGQDPRVVQAAVLARRNHLAEPLLVGSSLPIQSLWKQFDGAGQAPIIDPETMSTQDRDRWVHALLALSKFKSLSAAEAEARIKDPLLLGCLYTQGGMADGFIGGATRTTAETLKAVFSVIGLAPKATTLFGFFLIERHKSGSGNPFVLLADCAVTPEPSPKQLANIALGAAAAYDYFFEDQARVAFLSFSTHGSAVHPKVENVRQAVAMAQAKAPGLSIEGEWQADAALDLFSAKIKGVGDSPMAGGANVLIAPDLNCGNIAYKLVQRLGGCRAVGPILWGTALPANDLSRGCSSEDVLDMIALTTLQAKNSKALENPTHAG